MTGLLRKKSTFLSRNKSEFLFPGFDASHLISIAKFFIFTTTQIWFDFALVFAVLKKIPELIKLSGFIISLGFGFYFFILLEILFDDDFSMYRENLLCPTIIGILCLLHLYGSLISYECFKRLQKNPLNNTIYTIVEKV